MDINKKDGDTAVIFDAEMMQLIMEGEIDLQDALKMTGCSKLQDFLEENKIALNEELKEQLLQELVN